MDPFADVVIKELNDMRQAVMRTAVAVRNMAVMSEEDAVKADAARIEAAEARYKTSAEVLGKLIADPAGRALLERIAQGQAATAPGIARRRRWQAGRWT